MGDRRNIALKYPGETTKIYLYTHWGGSQMKQDLQEALKRGKGRWDDPSYLARIIFSELVKDDIMGETGYGIAPWETDPESTTIQVDLEKQTVDRIPFDEYITKVFRV